MNGIARGGMGSQGYKLDPRFTDKRDLILDWQHRIADAWDVEVSGGFRANPTIQGTFVRGRVTAGNLGGRSGWVTQYRQPFPRPPGSSGPPIGNNLVALAEWVYNRGRPTQPLPEPPEP